MPNWCFNRIDMPHALDFVSDKNGEQVFDFNNIIPMPKSLNIECGSDIEISVATYLTNGFTVPEELLNEGSKKLIDLLCCTRLFSFSPIRTVAEVIKDNKAHYEKCRKRQQAKFFRDGRTYVNNYLLYGFTDWYGWRNQYWGVKWNASDVWADEYTIEFDTPWGPPFPIIEAISRKFTEEKIEFEWSEEAGWRGHQLYLNGKVVEELTPSDCLDDYWCDPEEENDGESDESEENTTA